MAADVLLLVASGDSPQLPLDSSGKSITHNVLWSDYEHQLVLPLFDLPASHGHTHSFFLPAVVSGGAGDVRQGLVSVCVYELQNITTAVCFSLTSAQLAEDRTAREDQEPHASEVRSHLAFISFPRFSTFCAGITRVSFFDHNPERQTL
jgi:hypothetical protein